MTAPPPPTPPPTDGPILVVDDEPKIARILVEYLAAAGYATACLFDGREVEAFVRAKRPRLVVLDRMLPGRDGSAICRALRAFTDVPVIMLTARVEEADRLEGLDDGADDYICKPFSPREVVARVRAVLRRAEGRPMRAPITPEGSTRLFAVDVPRMRVTFHGVPLELTASEFRLLTTLLRHPGHVYSRAQLLARLHGDDEATSDRAIDTHMKNLRRKLQQIDPASNPLRAVYGVGYRLDLE